MASIKTVLKNSGIYGMSNILMKGISFFLLPLYTVYLTPSDYGIISVIDSYVGLLSLFVTFSLGRSATRFYFRYRSNEADIQELWGSIVTFVLITSVIIFVFLILFKDVLVNPFLKDIAFFPYMFLGIIPLIFNPTFVIYQTSLQIKHNAKTYAINNIGRFLIRLLLVLLLVIIFKLKATGVLLAGAITSVLFFIYSFWVFLPKIRLGIRKEKLFESLRFSIPLMPRSLAGWAYGMIDKIFLNNIKSSAEAGIYNVGFQFGFIMNFLVVSVHQAYKPWCFEKMESGENARNDIVKYVSIFVLLYGYIAMCISLFGEDILNIMVTKDFREGWKIIPLITFSFVLSGMNYFFSYPIEYSIKNAKLLIIPILGGSGINIILNIILIPVYGMIGAAITTFIAHLVTVTITLILLSRIDNIKFPWKKMYFYVFIFMTIGFISYFNTVDFIVSFFVIKAIVVMIVSSLIWIRHKNELSYVLSIILKKQKIFKRKTLK